jgi:hypothetical protein
MPGGMAEGSPAIVEWKAATTRPSPVSFRKNALTVWDLTAVSLEPDG